MGGERWRDRSGGVLGDVSAGVGEIGEASRRLIEGVQDQRYWGMDIDVGS